MIVSQSASQKLWAMSSVAPVVIGWPAATAINASANQNTERITAATAYAAQETETFAELISAGVRPAWW